MSQNEFWYYAHAHMQRLEADLGTIVDAIASGPDAKGVFKKAGIDATYTRAPERTIVLRRAGSTALPFFEYTRGEHGVCIMDECFIVPIIHAARIAGFSDKTLPPSVLAYERKSLLTQQNSLF